VLEFTDNVWVFFASAIFISLTGVMMPGPLFAATVEKGYKDERAGIKIALGHGLVEFPLMALIIVSLDYVFENDFVKLGIGLVGGALMLILGVSMFKGRKNMAITGKESIPYGPVVAGVITTSTNPYFLLWWATVGAVLVFNAQFFGPVIVLVFAIVHWSCDLGWYTFTTFVVFRTKHLWTPRVHGIVFGSCGALMMAFGVYFILGPTIGALDNL
jgi:threonine/homoserine/homoserine lactone efflux protein